MSWMEARTGCDAFVGLHIDSLLTPNQILTHLRFILKGAEVSTRLSTPEPYSYTLDRSDGLRVSVSIFLLRSFKRVEGAIETLQYHQVHLRFCE